MVLKRILAMILMPVFLFMMGSAAPAEGTGEQLPDIGQEDPGAKVFADRFGPDAVVETDGSGVPIAVNGYPVRVTDTQFNIRGVDEKVIAETDFFDYPFWRPATEYDGNLANMSLFMALCAARDRRRGEATEAFDPAQNLEIYLKSAGFEKIRKDDYSKETSLYTISTAIGARRMEHEGEEPFTLIAVGVCGGGYGNEWQSNLTAGNGDLHEGFRSASDLVIDRIAGYIAMNGIQGRVKIWISGFSRAAAVANLTAGRLGRVGVFPKEDIYAYTFATPAAVLNPPDGEDGNIFNILSPMDVVPQVMPAEWGYGRYGKDLFLPVPEFSSIGEAVTEQREEMIRENFGIVIKYSPALNLRMRLLTSMIMESLGSRENYVEHIQDTAVGILQQKNANNLLQTIRNMLLSMRGSSREKRARLDGLLNFMTRVFGNALTRTELAAVNRNSGSELFLLFTEHREDTYLANIRLIQMGVFEEDMDFTYVFARGPVTLELTDDNLPGWSMTKTAAGTDTIRYPDSDEAFTDPDFQPYYMERLRDVTIAAIPYDAPLRLKWTAEADGTVEVRQVRVGVRASSRYPGMTTGAIRVKAGDSGEAWNPGEREGTRPEGFGETNYSAEDLAGFLGIAAPFVSWRVLLTLGVLAAALILFLVIRLLTLLFPNRGRIGAASWCLLALFCVAAAEAEGAWWLQADLNAVRFACKAVAAAAVTGVFFLQRDKNEKLSKGIFPGFAALLAADVATAWDDRPGLVLFLMAHIVLILCFFRHRPISRGQWIQWGVISLLTAGLILLAFVPRSSAAGWAAVCAPVLFLTLYSLNGQKQRVRLAAQILLASDLLLGAYALFWTEPLAHILSQALFGIAVMLMALRGKKEDSGLSF